VHRSSAHISALQHSLIPRHFILFFNLCFQRVHGAQVASRQDFQRKTTQVKHHIPRQGIAQSLPGEDDQLDRSSQLTKGHGCYEPIPTAERPGPGAFSASPALPKLLQRGKKRGAGSELRLVMSQTLLRPTESECTPF